ncbi:MAG TPA: hypothetical protein VM681_09985 [Candidatus Thermoplasmatota archaeon]|nr:hypothetical protein [Candidatus Thermoplasmatota archaeon]
MLTGCLEPSEGATFSLYAYPSEFVVATDTRAAVVESFKVAYFSGVASRWTVESDAPWVSFETSDGSSVSSGPFTKGAYSLGEAALLVRMDPAGLAFGEHVATIVARGGGGQVSVPVRLTVADLPTVSGLSLAIANATWVLDERATGAERRPVALAPQPDGISPHTLYRVSADVPWISFFGSAEPLSRKIEHAQFDLGVIPSAARVGTNVGNVTVRIGDMESTLSVTLVRIPRSAPPHPESNPEPEGWPFQENDEEPLPEGWVRVTGRAWDAEDDAESRKSVAGARVRFEAVVGGQEPQTGVAWANHSGAYRFDVPEGATVRVWAEKPCHRLAQAEFAAAANAPDLVLLQHRNAVPSRHETARRDATLYVITGATHARAHVAPIGDVCVVVTGVDDEYSPYDVHVCRGSLVGPTGPRGGSGAPYSEDCLKERASLGQEYLAREDGSFEVAARAWHPVRLRFFHPECGPYDGVVDIGWREGHPDPRVRAEGGPASVDTRPAPGYVRKLGDRFAGHIVVDDYGWVDLLHVGLPCVRLVAASDEAGLVRGVVHDGRTGVPLSRVRLLYEVEDARGNRVGGNATTRSDAGREGEFSFRVPAGASWTLELDVPCYQPLFVGPRTGTGTLEPIKLYEAGVTIPAQGQVSSGLFAVREIVRSQRGNLGGVCVQLVPAGEIRPGNDWTARSSVSLRDRTIAGFAGTYGLVWFQWETVDLVFSHPQCKTKSIRLDADDMRRRANLNQYGGAEVWPGSVLLECDFPPDPPPPPCPYPNGWLTVRVKPEYHGGRDASIYIDGVLRAVNRVQNYPVHQEHTVAVWLPGEQHPLWNAVVRPIPCSNWGYIDR